MALRCFSPPASCRFRSSRCCKSVFACAHRLYSLPPYRKVGRRSCSRALHVYASRALVRSGVVGFSRFVGKVLEGFSACEDVRKILKIERMLLDARDCEQSTV